MKDSVFCNNHTLNVGGKILDFTLPKIMGVLNATPDSFYAGGRNDSLPALLRKAGQMLEEGADVLDIGGYSSRPNAADVSLEEELSRVIPAIKAVKEHFPTAVVSVDTFRAEVALRAIESGASIVNDISGGELDKEMYPLVARQKVPYILMHMRGTPQNMSQNVSYENLILELMDYFQRKIFTLRTLGVSDIVVDLGFGFSKTREQNFSLLNSLANFKMLDCPLLVGISRKSMVYKTLGISPDEALNGTTVLHTIALIHGASVLRVHDVKPATEAIKLVNQLHTNRITVN